MPAIPKYIILEKMVGETPLSCAEAYREEHPELEGVPMAYAGRLDPMASGKLLILLGDECKNQANYHGLDKEYEFSVLFGIESDSQDVLGRLKAEKPDKDRAEPAISSEKLISLAKELKGDIELPYPLFSAKTVKGKPLHTWTMEDRLDEIEIPTKQSTVHTLNLTKIEMTSRSQIATEARVKIDTIPPVTEMRKALGNDFRRVDVRQDWENIKNDPTLPSSYTIATFSCIASSGTYMRTLAELIAKKLNRRGLAWHIHRTKIGVYDAERESWTTLY